MSEVMVSKTSCILSAIIFILLVLSVGLLVVVLKGKEISDESIDIAGGAFTHIPNPYTDHKVLSPNDQPGSADHADNTPWKSIRLSKYILPEHYDLLLQPDLETDIFTGTVNITVSVARETKHFIVHSQRLSILEAKVYDLDKDAELQLDVQFFYPPNEYYVVQTEKKVKQGKHKLYFRFSGTLNGSIVGFYKSRYMTDKNEIRYLATSKFQPTYARQAFPCFDEPSFKSTFSVSLVHEKEYTALSNMPAEIMEPIPDTNLFVTRFQKSVPMVTYLACFIVCDFEYKAATTASGKPFRVYSVPHLVNTTSYALEVGSKVLDYFENYFDIDYPLPKMDMIAIPDFSSGAMEHWGLITFRETNLLYDPNKSSPQDQQRVAEVIAHEMTHMWFGNLVTMEWWDDLWLNEGFASYMEYKGVDHCHPEWKAMSRLITTDLQPVMNADSSDNSHPIVQRVGHPDEITEIFDRISYAKGASILRMLEFFAGKEKFRINISGFLKKHEYKNARTADLWEEFSASNGYLAGPDIFSIMRTWTEQMGFPYITIKRKSVNSTSFVVKQNRFLKNVELWRSQPQSPQKYVWSIPLSYKTSDNNTGIVWIYDDKETEIILPVENSNWVKFNVNQTGYYLVNYEEEGWQKLINLLLTNHEALTPSDRSNLLFDSFLLAQAGYIELDVFMSMSVYLKKETDVTPWLTASACFQRFADWVENTEASLLLKSYVSGLTDDLYKKLGWTASDSHTENLLRTTILNLACGADHQDCLDQASQLFKNWTQGGEQSTSLHNLVLKYGISTASTEDDWNHVWNKYLTEHSPVEKTTYLKNLGNVKMPHLISKYLEYSMDENKVRSQDFFTVLNSEIDNPVGRPFVWNFIRENWPAIVERFSLNSRYLGNVVNKVCSKFTTEQQLQEMAEFFFKYPDAGAGRRGRIQALETVKNNIHWLRTHSGGAQNWLQTESPAPWHYYRLPAYIIPEHYDIRLHPLLDEDIFNGSTAITVNLKKPSNHFIVHAVDLNISETRVYNLNDSVRVEVEETFEYKKHGYWVIRTKKVQPVGMYGLHFQFLGPLTVTLNGLYKSSYVDPETNERRYLITSQFEAVYARKAFPCFDEPTFRSTFSVNIVHDADHYALSNTAVMDFTGIGKDLRLTKFRKTVPMVTYLLCIVICDFKFRQTETERGVILRVYTAPHYIEKTYYSLDVASRALTWFERYFNIPFPLRKLDLIAIPDYGSNGMENWGLITFSEPSLISDNVTSEAAISHITNIIAHELAHMWFGDLVTMKWWSDLWLNEGFATYMSIKASQVIEPDFDREGDKATSYMLYAMKEDETINSHPIVQTVTNPSSGLFDSITYDKGSTVLRMLENYMGRDFRRGITMYLKKNSFKNTETRDLWDELSAASKKNLNVSAMMDTWTKQMNYPFISIQRTKNNTQYFIQQRRFLSNPSTELFATRDSPYNYVWQIPITYYTADNNQVSQLFLNSSDKVQVTLPNSKWIKFNVNFTGYYLVNYDSKTWNIFTEVLKTDHTVFSPSDRLNLMHEAFALSWAGHLDYKVPLNLTKYLWKERYHGVWTVVLKELKQMRWLLRGDKEMDRIILELVRSLSRDLYKEYSWKELEDFSERRLQKTIIKAACASENQDCLQTASRLFGDWMRGEELNSEIKEVVYQYGLQVHNNDEAWNFMWKRYLEENDLYDKRDILFAMTTIANTTLLESLMKKAANESEVRKHEYLDLMNSIAENPKGFVLVTRLIYSNWTHLVKNYGANQASFFANNVFSKYSSQRDLEQVRAFYRKNGKSTDSARDRTQTIDEINNNIHWMNKHRTYVQKWFQDNVYMPWRSMRLPDFVQPNRYNITLQPDIVTSTFTGEETIDFNGKKLAVAEVITYKRNDFLVIRFEDKTPPGSYVLQLEFSGRFSSDGKGVARYKYFDRATRETRFVLATQFEATFARKVFPCFDEPAMKAKFQLTIIHDSNQNALSNMPEMEKEPLENGLTKTVFLESTTMSTYLLFFAVSDFEYIQAYYKEKLKIRVFAPKDRLPEAQHGLNLTLNLLKSFEEYFDVPYSLPKLDSVIIENYTVPAMEHWGIISYNTKRFLVDENYSTYKRMIEVDRVIAHEIVHQWFGNLVTMKWWNDLWLSEGLATLIMYIPLKQYYTEIDGVDVRKISRVMCVDSNTDSHPVVRNVTTPNEIANAFDAISYEKGSAVLKMLQHTLKDDFRKGLSNYLKKYAFKNAETEDLWRELSEASTMKINVSQIMATWTGQIGFPLIELKRDSNRLTAKQRWFVRDLSDTVSALLSQKVEYNPFGFKWQIPLVYKNFRTGEEHTLWLKNESSTYLINATNDDVLHFNPGFVGFYVVKYDSHDWARLGKRLINDHLTFSVGDRYSLLHDAFLLAETDRLIYDIPFELTKYLKSEKEPMPWNLFRDQFLYFMSHLDPHSETAKLLKLYVANLTSALYDEHVVPVAERSKSLFKKWKSNIVSCSYTVPDLDFTSIVIDLACRTSNPKCLKSLLEELHQWIGGEIITADLPLVFKVAIPQYAGRSLWDFLYSQMSANENDLNRRKVMAEGLTSFRSSKYIEKSINILANDPGIDAKLAKFMFEKLVNNPSAMPQLWNYTKHNWNNMMERLNSTDNYSLWISSFCEKFKTKEQYDDMVLFLGQVPRVSEYIARGCIQDIQDSLSWSNKYEETINTWLVWNVNQ
ncbi:hypothetical protein CDAR_74672 [Caerostris darwini]|uniref:glutamyl aminopeptidase n=1 Tax=Caerostris darwini TaxID=1538125 RepID=A0AAV4P1N5_9ARAC|nr:hypothetical protein CDAR_74672 [Caerostris darwini]